MEQVSMRQNKDFTVKDSLSRWLVTHVNSKSLSLMHNLYYFHDNVVTVKRNPLHDFCLPQTHNVSSANDPRMNRTCLHGFNLAVYKDDDPHQHMKKRFTASDIPLSIAA